MRIVQEALRPDRDKGARQGALHAAAGAVLEAVKAYTASRKVGRMGILEQPERAILAILRDMVVSSPTLTPRASDHAPEVAPARATPERPVSLTAPRSELPAEADREFLREFAQEAREYLEEAGVALLAVERRPDDAEAARTVLRAFHSIKGTAGFLRLTSIVELTHHAESLLGAALTRAEQVGAERAALALRTVDMLSALVAAAEATLEGAPHLLPAGYAALVAELQAECGEESGGDDEAPGSILLTTAEMTAHPPLSRDLEPATARVQTDRLDKLVDLAGELVIAHWMIAQDPVVVSSAHSAAAKKVAHAGKIVRELHEMSMALRMVPLRSTCRRVARLVRDVARQMGKDVRSEIEGEATELDRNMVEMLSDPLMHMVRNAIAHGIESPGERRALGKPEAGLVRLRASHASGQVVVELSDDGRGIQLDAVRRRAVDVGLARPGDILGEAETLEMIFRPGMSTADHLTEVAGRGVGMDVVQRNVQALRGRVEVRTAAGVGTTFTLRVPLTLAVTDGMLVRVGDERFIVPTTNIVLSFRPEAGALSTVVGRGEVARLRDEILPIVRLHRVLEVEGAVEEATAGLLMVVGAGERRAALLVDAILGQQQVVAKSVQRGIGSVPEIAGAAILGDGRVGLILDVAQVIGPARHDGGVPPTERAVA